MTGNPYAAAGRERKALAIEHALRQAGIDNLAALDRYVIPDPRIRELAERSAADALGHTWRKPASLETWARVRDLYAADRTHAHAGGTR